MAFARAAHDLGEAARRRRTAAERTEAQPATAALSLEETLEARGYEPAETAAGEIRFRNCPFHALVEDHRDLVCNMNLALADGSSTAWATTVSVRGSIRSLVSAASRFRRCPRAYAVVTPTAGRPFAELAGRALPGGGCSPAIGRRVRSTLATIVGTLANRVRLQDEFEPFVLVADYHMLTTRAGTGVDVRREHPRGRARNLAAGVDPAKATIYLQSQVPETAELFLLLGMLVTVPRLRRIPTLKDKLAEAQRLGTVIRAAWLPDPPGERHPVGPGRRRTRRA